MHTTSLLVYARFINPIFLSSNDLIAALAKYYRKTCTGLIAHLNTAMVYTL